MLGFKVTPSHVEHQGVAPADVVSAQRSGPVWALQRHLRRRIVLHASAHLLDDKAICVAAFPGTGKSTLSTRLRARGAGFLSDDLASIGDDLRVEAGPPHVRLWPDTRAWAGIEDASLRQLVQGHDKQVMDLEPVAEDAPLGAVFFLERGAATRVHSLRASQGVVELARHTYLYHMYRPRCRQWPEDQWHFRLAARMAGRIPMFRLTVRDGLENVEPATRLVLQETGRISA